MSSNTPIVFDGKCYRIRGVDYENTYGLVVFLDALGIKEIWKTKYPEKVLESWNKVYYVFYDELDHLSGMNLSAFSDTIIISMHGHMKLINQPTKLILKLSDCRSVNNDQ